MTFVPVTEMTTMQLADAVFSQLDTDDLGYEYDELLRRLALADPEAMVARVLEAVEDGIHEAEDGYMQQTLYAAIVPTDLYSYADSLYRIRDAIKAAITDAIRGAGA